MKEKDREVAAEGGAVAAAAGKIELMHSDAYIASELNLDMRSDGFVKVNDLLKLKLKTFANVPLSSHTVDEIKDAVRRDNKQRFSLLEENGELLIHANQGHSTMIVETDRLLKPILTFEEVPVCVHGTYRKNLDSQGE